MEKDLLPTYRKEGAVDESGDKTQRACALSALGVLQCRPIMYSCIEPLQSFRGTYRRQLEEMAALGKWGRQLEGVSEGISAARA